MFITCQECNTTFRLDERLLKPTGSKVRCSQCLNTFVAKPPSSQPHYVRQAVPAFESPAQPRVAPSRIAQEQELEGIDLAELDAILDADTASKKESDRPNPGQEAVSDEDAELDELELDFDFDTALDSKNVAATPSMPTAAEDSIGALDLDMDFELEVEPSETKEEAEDWNLDSLRLDDAPEAQRPSPEALEEGPLEDDLAMALDSLDLEPEKAPVVPKAVAPTMDAPKAAKSIGSNDLDLADIDLDLSDTAKEEETLLEEPELSLAENAEPELIESAAAPSAGKKDPSSLQEDAGLGLEGLELELEEAPETAGETDNAALDLSLDSSFPEENDEIDLSDLDAMLGVSDEKGDSDASDDLEIQFEEALDSGGSAARVSSGDLEDLELVSEFENTKTDQKPLDDTSGALPDDDEIDLSEIEQMLDNATTTSARMEMTPVEDLQGDGGEIDLSDIESAIDRAGEEEDSAGFEDPELDLDLDSDRPFQDRATADDLQLEKNSTDVEELDLELELESASTPVAKDSAGSHGDELDLSDLAELVDSNDAKGKRDIVDTGDIELEFEIEEDEKRAPVPAPGKNRERKPVIPVEEAAETLFVDEKPVKKSKPRPIKRKKKSSKSLVLLLILLLLGAAGYGLYYAVTQMGVEIPYFNEYIKPYVSKYIEAKPADPNGTLNLSTLEINSKFIENGQSGRLFVITGKVRNGYSVPRSMVRLQAKLYTKGKVLVKTEYSYAGTMIDDQDLARLSIAEIKQRLNQDVSASVRPGQNLTFMLVFSDLPPAEELDEFAVEVVASAPGA